MSFDNTRQKGTFYEDIACKYIEENDATVIERNYSCKNGEIDIIARDEKYLCFVEVKFRASNKYGDAADAVMFSKQRKICKVAEYYMFCNGYDEFSPVRFDVLIINSDNMGSYMIKWHKDAFDYIKPKGRRF